MVQLQGGWGGLRKRIRCKAGSFYLSNVDLDTEQQARLEEHKTQHRSLILLFDLA